MNYVSVETLVSIIRDYWKQRGYKISVEVQECARLGRKEQIVPYRAVRSNLLNAMPRGYTGELAVMER